MSIRLAATLALALAVFAGPGIAPVFAQATPQKPAAAAPAKAEPAKAAPAKAAAKDDEDDSPSSAAQKKACDAKWKIEKEKTKASGWKAYFTFMSKCM
jgi:hypothetical protein